MKYETALRLGKTTYMHMALWMAMEALGAGNTLNSMWYGGTVSDAMAACTLERVQGELALLCQHWVGLVVEHNMLADLVLDTLV